MNVRLGSFAKKKNSTAVPSGGLVTTITGALRDGCSVERPMIGFAADRMTSPVRYNYAFVVEFARYYYIQDWEWYKGLWWAHMEVDPMATYKTQIGAASCYVLRAAAESDPFISDSIYPTKCIKLTTRTALEPIWPANSFIYGMYVIGVVGRGSSAGAINYYVLNPAEMNTLRDFLMSDSTYLGNTEITSELLKALFNPFQYIVSAMWFPITAADFPVGQSGNIACGWWNTSVSGIKLVSFHKTLHTTFDISASPYAVADGKQYLASTPFSQYFVYYPPFGEIELDAQILASYICGSEEETFTSVEIGVDVKIDFITGQAYLRMTAGGYEEVAYREAQIGVPCQLGQITADIGRGISTMIKESDTNVLRTMTDPAGQIMSNLAAVYDGLSQAMPRALISGNQSGESVSSLEPVLTVTYNRQVERTNEEVGSPLCKTKTISTLPGYIKTMNSDIVIQGATDAEQEHIRGIMNGGFFYE